MVLLFNISNYVEFILCMYYIYELNQKILNKVHISQSHSA